MTEWYRSRHTGRYFLFGIGYVEKMYSGKWKAGLLFGKRRPVVYRKNMTEARKWVETFSNQRKED